jgi:MYXO-CTERM domain-containing protein
VVTRKTPQGAVVCAPPGTVLEGCVTPPTCVCKGQHGCDDPCVDVACEGGLVCSPWAKTPGSCVVDNCWNFPCQGCGRACNLGSCVDSPCKEGSCKPGEACKPSEDFTSSTCSPSCAGVVCPQGKACKDGACVPTCDPACAAPLVCDASASPPSCVPSRCDADRCKDGSCCDPVTGACGNCPCEGVVCPAGQACHAGECAVVAGSGGSGGSGSAPGAGGAGAADAGANATPKASSDDERVWGLATGGGGCACETGPGGARGTHALGLVVALLGAVAARRRRGAGAGRREVAR